MSFERIQKRIAVALQFFLPDPGESCKFCKALGSLSDHFIENGILKDHIRGHPLSFSQFPAKNPQILEKSRFLGGSCGPAFGCRGAEARLCVFSQHQFHFAFQQGPCSGIQFETPVAFGIYRQIAQGHQLAID